MRRDFAAMEEEILLSGKSGVFFLGNRGVSINLDWRWEAARPEFSPFEWGRRGGRSGGGNDDAVWIGKKKKEILVTLA